MRQPNVLLITVDCLRPDHLGSYGYRLANTPCMDELADRGVRFSQAISTGGWTIAAFPALLTSTFASMHTGWRGGLGPARPRLAKLLQQAGYHTAAFVTNPLLDVLGYSDGFERFVSAELAESEPDWVSWPGMQRLLRLPRLQRLLGILGRPVPPGLVYVPAAELTPVICQHIHSTTAPFFVWIHYMDAHWPYHLKRSLTNPDRWAEAWEDRRIAYRAMNREIGRLPDRQGRQRILELYDEAVAEVDMHVAVVLEALGNERGQTHIVLTADHGEAFGEHGYYGHDRIGLYDEVVRVPLLWSGPGVIQPAVCHDPVSLLDIPPALLDLLGLPVPDAMLGRSLGGVLHGSQTNRRLMTISESPWDWDTEFSVALRTSRHKFIHHRGKPDETELYDLLADPGEKGNIASRFPDLVCEFTRALESHLAMIESSCQSTQDIAWDDEVVGRLEALGYLAQ